MTLCCLRGVSVFGPGLPLWHAARPVLRGDTPLSFIEEKPPAPALLSANERRRSGLPVRLALAVSEEAVRMAGLGLDQVGAVFASANGEGAIVHGLLETLAGPDRLLSPTHFHNSVHNAVAGYWSIATGSAQPVTCLGCHDWSFAAGLLKAVAETRVTGRDTLLCVYDAPLPAPLAAGHETDFAFAAAFVLSPDPAPSALARLRVDYDATPATGETARPRQAGLRDMSRRNAACRALGLLEAIALERADRFSLDLLDGSIDIEILP